MVYESVMLFTGYPDGLYFFFRAFFSKFFMPHTGWTQPAESEDSHKTERRQAITTHYFITSSDDLQAITFQSGKFSYVDWGPHSEYLRGLI